MWADLVEIWSASIGAMAALAALALCWRARRVRVDPGWHPASSDLDVICESRIAAIIKAGQRSRMLDTLAITSLAIAALATCAACGGHLIER